MFVCSPIPGMSNTRPQAACGLRPSGSLKNLNQKRKKKIVCHSFFTWCCDEVKVVGN